MAVGLIELRRLHRQLEAQQERLAAQQRELEQQRQQLASLQRVLAESRTQHDDSEPEGRLAPERRSPRGKRLATHERHDALHGHGIHHDRPPRLARDPFDV